MLGNMKINCSECGKVIKISVLMLKLGGYPQYCKDCFKKIIRHAKDLDGLCHHCKGTGIGDDKLKCNRCNGTGKDICTNCDGTGKIKGYECQRCGGKGKLGGKAWVVDFHGKEVIISSANCEFVYEQKPKKLNVYQR